MKTFLEALEDGGFEDLNGSWRMTFGDNYELWFEQLLFDKQYFVALYENKNLIGEKVVVKPGKEAPKHNVKTIKERHGEDFFSRINKKAKHRHKFTSEEAKKAVKKRWDKYYADN